MRNALLFGIIVVTVFGWSFVASWPLGAAYAQVVPQSSPQLSLAEFVKRVDAAHPERALEDKTIEAIQKTKEAVSPWPDPQFSFGRDRQSLSFLNKSENAATSAASGGGGHGSAASAPTSASNSGASEAAWTLGWEQMIPWPKVRKLQQDVIEARVKKQVVSNETSRIARRISAAEFFLSHASLSQNIALQKNNLAEASRITQLSAARLSHGLGSHHELVAAQNEQTVLQLNIQAEETELENMRAVAASLLNMGASNPTGPILALSLPETSKVRWQEVLGVVEDPVLQGVQLARAERHAQFEADIAQTMPQFMVEGMLMRDDAGMYMASGMIGVRVPLFSAAERKALDQQKTLLNESAELQANWHERRKALALGLIEKKSAHIQRTLKTLQDVLLPNAREHLSTIVAEFAQGKGNLRTVTDARKALLALEEARLRFHEESLRTEISRVKAQSGFADEELNTSLPRLDLMPSGAESMGMTAGGGNGVMGNGKGMGGMKGRSMQRSVPSPVSPRPQPQPKSQETDMAPSEPAGGGGGMGGMGM